MFETIKKLLFCLSGVRSGLLVCFATFLFAVLGLGPVLADPERLQCQVPEFTVEAGSATEAQSICTLISDALPALEACHLTVASPVTLIVTEDMSAVGARCLGYYDAGQREIRVRSAQGMATSIDPESAFGGLESGLLFGSTVVHEVAHALFDQNAASMALCSDNHEYVAHAMQMAWLPDPVRAQILQKYQIDNPVDERLLNSLIAGLDPEQYAALVWQHFAQPGNGCAFFKRVLIGEATLQMLPQ